MVPAVVNIVASKGKDTYSGFISEITCFKCRTFSVGNIFFMIYANFLTSISFKSVYNGN